MITGFRLGALNESNRAVGSSRTKERAAVACRRKPQPLNARAGAESCLTRQLTPA